MRQTLHTDLPKHSENPREYFREHKKRWLEGREFPCECGRGPKTSRMRGCQQCNEEQERYELHGAAREEATRRNQDSKIKYAEWAINFVCGTGSKNYANHH